MGSPVEFQVTDCLGVFYRDNQGHLMVADEFEGVRDIDALLKVFDGSVVTMVVHHRPVEPVDKELWGGGCCYLTPIGHCPFGHHKNPGDLYTFSATGLLSADSLTVGDAPLYLDFLVGHRSQMIIMVNPDQDKIDSKIDSLNPSNLPPNATLEELQQRVQQTRDFLEELNQLKDKL